MIENMHVIIILLMLNIVCTENANVVQQTPPATPDPDELSAT